ncbi:amino acid ABC transporter substrate-binding protein (PAAT family) [Iodobacter fluviatilis]|uniref:Amino acid ABC transporter substrate-binding protein (PAAT family) n=2 Tax=Iodobacter fluviatilis TaxID=537 RepID=A0A377Q7H7_9NEIS|nr:amino acid ABC transporter substrate-binding protein (PAAT family) [Iodobacter fluviatilis]STQ90705.1 Sulfate starvation-induced protein 7 [Iodobacter fluviatilis]
MVSRCKVSATLCALALGVCSSLFAASPCLRPLIVGWDTWPPYHFKDEKGRMQGLAVEVLQALAKRVDCPLQFAQMPWKRTLNELAQGKADLAMEVLKTPERERTMLFSRAYRPSNVHFFVRKKDGRWSFNTLAELSKLGPVALGVSRGDSYGVALDQWLKTPPAGVIVDVAPTMAINLIKLQHGRVDLLLGDLLATQAAIYDLKLADELAPLAQEWPTQEAYFAFSRVSVSQPVFQAFQQALEDLIKDGTLKQIQQRYLVRRP